MATKHRRTAAAQADYRERLKRHKEALAVVAEGLRRSTEHDDNGNLVGFHITFHLNENQQIEAQALALLADVQLDDILEQAVDMFQQEILKTARQARRRGRDVVGNGQQTAIQRRAKRGQ